MEEEIRAVAEAILCRAEEAGFVRIFSHYDADGLTSAGILCNAFLRKEFLSTRASSPSCRLNYFKR